MSIGRWFYKRKPAMVTGIVSSNIAYFVAFNASTTM